MFDHQGTADLVGRIFDGYRITEYLARGGMGLVYKAVQESLNRPVAIKFLYPHLSADESFRERFEREARAAAALSHPNIVRILDFGQQDGLHYMVLDFIDGESLRDYLARLHSDGLLLRTDRAVRILEEIGAALSYAHARGFVHRDVKPGNILFTSDGRALLSDFGVVKAVGLSQMTTAGAMIGTPEYVAPEQGMNAATIGPEADQYALGIVAYEILTGRVPFQAQTPTAVLRMHMSEAPPPPSTFVPWMSPDAEAVLMKALAKNPADRHESVAVFVERLAAALAQSPTLHGAPTGQWPAHDSGGQPPTGLPPSMVSAGGSDGDAEGSRRVFGWPIFAVFFAALLLGALLVGGVVGGILLFRGDDDGSVAALDPTATTAATEEPAAPPTEADQQSPTATPPVAESTATEAGDPSPTAPEAEETATTEAGETETPTAEEVAATTAPEGCYEVILFAAHRGEVHDSQIYIMNPDGADQRQLTFARGHSWGPRISPDGTQFIFSSVAPGEHEEHGATGGGTEGLGNHQIYIANVDGSGIVNLTTESLAWDNAWSWSPDGALITFTSDRTGNWELYTMTTDGESVNRLTNTPYNEGWPAWTPDGRFIVFASDQTGTSEIYIMESDGSNVRRLTDRTDSFDTYPFVSPDGTKIVFSSQIPAVNEGEIYVMDIDGGNVTRLTSTAALNYAPSWSLDGSKIVFVSDRTGADNIWVMDADGSNQTQLTNDPGEDTTPTWGYACIP